MIAAAAGLTVAGLGKFSIPGARGGNSLRFHSSYAISECLLSIFMLSSIMTEVNGLLDTDRRLPCLPELVQEIECLSSRQHYLRDHD